MGGQTSSANAWKTIERTIGRTAKIIVFFEPNELKSVRNLKSQVIQISIFQSEKTPKIDSAKC